MKIEVKKRLFYKVKHNDTLQDISKLFNIDENIIKSYNGISSVEEGDVVFFPESNYYIVKPGDTFSDIAKKLGLTEAELKTKTGCSKFFIGQKIYLGESDV